MDQRRINAHHRSGLFAAAVAALPFRAKLSGNQPPVQVRKNRALCIQMMADLRDGFAVSTVTVQNNKMTETIIIELIANALQQCAKSLHAQRNRSGEADDIRRRTIVHSWRDHCVRHGRIQLCNAVRYHRIRAERHMLSMVFDTADRNHNRIAGLQIFFHIQIIHFFKEHSVHLQPKLSHILYYGLAILQARYVKSDRQFSHGKKPG